MNQSQRLQFIDKLQPLGIVKRGIGNHADEASDGAVTENISITHDGTNSVVIIKDLPTSDPSVAGQIWSNSGVLTVSAG